MSIEQLFSTPEQGRRLNELVPMLTSAFLWASLQEGTWFIAEQQNITDGAFVEFRPTFTPALTLQELRDVAKKANHAKFNLSGTFLLESFDYHELENLLDTATAPELATWVIERLEATP